MKFTDLKTTQKGRIGERIVRGLLDRWGWRYKEAPNRSHLIDFVAVTARGEHLGVEVKTYPRRAFKKDTGIDAADFEKYSNMGMDAILIFVDQFEGCIYGQRLSNIKDHAFREGWKVYFPLERMQPIRRLSASELKQLARYPLSTHYVNTKRHFIRESAKAG
jgi:hypothetical protein